MDFAAKLQSPSIVHQSEAALFLRAEGANGAKHLPLLLSKCQAVDVTKSLDRFEEALLRFGALTMGGIVGEIGFDADKSLHVSILQWISQSTSSPNIHVVVHAIYGLGNLRAKHPHVLQRLSALVTSSRRADEYEHVSVRAIALRNLRRLDASMAEKLVDAPAFDEYAHALEHWIETDQSKAAESLRELQNELAWLKEIKTRRTKP